MGAFTLKLNSNEGFAYRAVPDKSPQFFSALQGKMTKASVGIPVETFEPTRADWPRPFDKGAPDVGPVCSPMVCERGWGSVGLVKWGESKVNQSRMKSGRLRRDVAVLVLYLDRDQCIQKMKLEHRVH